MSQRQRGLLEGVLPAHPRLLPDELFSHWLARTAKANRLKVQAFACLVAGDSRTPFWNRDKDRSASEELLKSVAWRTVTPIEEVRESTVADLAERISGRHQPNGLSAWVLPLGVWHRKRTQFGSQFCALCLKLDRTPYVRRSWRMAFYTECERHHILLEDRCSHCQAPFCFHRSELGQSKVKDGLPLTRCTACSFDLTDLIPQRMDWPTWEHAAAVRALLLQRGLPEVSFDQVREWKTTEAFAVLRKLIAMMSSTQAVSDLYDYVGRNIWPEGFSVLSSRGTVFEHRNVPQRHMLFGMAVWLLLEWPHRLERAIDVLNLTRTDLSRDSSGVPAWFLELGRTHARNVGLHTP